MVRGTADHSWKCFSTGESWACALLFVISHKELGAAFKSSFGLSGAVADQEYFYSLRGEAPGGIQCRPRLLPTQPCAPGSRFARRECVRAADRVPAFAARAAHVPGHSSYDLQKSTQLDPPTIAALQPICSPSLLPCLYGTSIPWPENPDFLLSNIRQGRVCGFLRGKPHTARQRHQPRQEIRGRHQVCP
jgi:hypothetical protein